MVTVDVLLGRRDNAQPPDVVLSIVDASNLERNLFLVSQVLSLGLPTVVALNMVDVARDRQVEIDILALSERLGVPVVPVQANRRLGWSGSSWRLRRLPRRRPRIERIRYRKRFNSKLASWPTG